MKTCSLYCILMACIATACSSSENTPNISDQDEGSEVDYTLLLRNDNTLYGTTFHANALMVSGETAGGQFEAIMTPDEQYRDGNVISYFTKLDNCSGELAQYRFKEGGLKRFPVFADLENCGLQVMSIAHDATGMYLAFGIPGAGFKKTDYFIRKVETPSGALIFPDVALSETPAQIVLSNGRLFILSALPDGETFILSVRDAQTGEVITEVSLDRDVLKIFKTAGGDILVAYPDFHIIISNQTLGITSTVRYLAGKEPNFGNSDTSYQDGSGILYYPMPTGLSGTTYQRIPGVYDFSRNTAILYYYENFLSDTDRDFKYEIEDTSMVSFDNVNNLLLIGYRKSGNTGAGGLIRIKPAPEPKFIDNTDLEGVPVEVFIE